MTDLVFELQPKQQEFRKAMDRWPVTFYGGAKGGGKSHGMREIFLLRRFQYPGSHGAIFRRSFPELDANHIRPLFRARPYLRQYWNESKKILTLPNQSTLQFCYCENEKDLDNYQGQEFHDLGIEEAGQWTEVEIKRLRGSNRSSLAGIIPRMALTGNPGGIGHGYLKRVFIQKIFKPEERPSDYFFIQALVQDNPALIHNDPDYVHRLEAEPNEALRKAYLYGDWDIFAGQFFQEISRSVHVVKAFTVPHHWNKFGAYDYGFNHPGAFGWFANDEDGNTYMYRELVKAQLRVDQFAAELNKHDDTKDLAYVVAGHDCWAKKSNTINAHQGQNPPTIAEEFAAHGIHLKQAIIDRIQGASQLRSYLAWKDRPPLNKPRLYMFESCTVTFDTISRMIHDPDRLEDVLKVDALDGDVNSGDDAYDMCRYGMMSRPAITDALDIKHPVGSRDWYLKQNKIDWQAERERLENEQGQQGGWPTDSGFGRF